MDYAAEARALAEEMKRSADSLPPDLRSRFIALRTALLQRGTYDPILGRFDSYTAPRATVAEVADQLLRLADNVT